MTYHNSTLSADHIQHISSTALQQGGFAEFYQAQVRLFVEHVLFLFSNVLDMAQHERFNIAKLACFMRGAIDPALCIAVSPHFISGERGFELIQDHLPIYRTPVDEVFQVNTLTYRLKQGLQMRSCTGRALACLFDIEAPLCDSPDDELAENSSSIISEEMLACI